jgi:hypothetical protein
MIAWQAVGISQLLPPDAALQVKRGIEVYKNVIRQHISAAVPFYPLGMPDLTYPITQTIVPGHGNATEGGGSVCAGPAAVVFCRPVSHCSRS